MTQISDVRHTVVREQDRVHVDASVYGANDERLAGLPGTVLKFHQDEKDLILRAFVLFDNGKTGWFNSAQISKIGGAK